MNTSEVRLALHLDSCTKYHVGNVCAVDELTSSLPIVNLPKIFIVNTDPHDLPGKHWVCLYVPYNAPIEFFDSLGHHPNFYSPLFEKFIYSHSDEFIYSTVPLQSNYSITCGHFCLFYGVRRCRGASMNDILHLFSTNWVVNDKIVQNFVKEHFNPLHYERFTPFNSSSCQNCLSPQKRKV